MTSKLTKYAKKLRKNSTKAETILWNILRSKQLEGTKFRRQQPIENYIVDFVSNALDIYIIGHYSQIGHIWRLIMNKEISLAEAKATLSECIREVEKGKMLIIKRHGKPVAALVQPQDLDNMERLRKAGPEGGLSSVSGGWEGSEDLVRILEESKRYGQREEGQLE
jgi:prevent-host-death family protein